MSNFIQHDWTGGSEPDPERLAQLQAKLDAASSRTKGPLIHIQQPKNGLTFTMKNGEATMTKMGVTTAYATAPTPEGMVELPGVGRTRIDAAVAARLLPAGWKPGDPTPGFEKAAGAHVATPSAPFGSGSKTPCDSDKKITATRQPHTALPPTWGITAIALMVTTPPARQPSKEHQPPSLTSTTP